MITIEDNYLITPDEAKNIIASWLDIWLEHFEENQKVQTDSNSAA